MTLLLIVLLLCIGRYLYEFLTFLQLCKQKKQLSFVSDNIFKNVYIVNQLKRYRQCLHLQKRVGLFMVQYNKKCLPLRQRDRFVSSSFIRDWGFLRLWFLQCYACADIILPYYNLWKFKLGEPPQENDHTLGTTIAVYNELSFVSEPRISCFLLASIKCQQTRLLACKQHKISDTSWS